MQNRIRTLEGKSFADVELWILQFALWTLVGQASMASGPQHSDSASHFGHILTKRYTVADVLRCLGQLHIQLCQTSVPSADLRA